MGDRALDVIEIVAATRFYDYEAKYAPGGSKHLLPAPISPFVYQEVRRLALKAHHARRRNRAPPSVCALPAMSLLQRLAQVGLGRRDDEHAAQPAPRPVPAPRPAARGPEPVSDYAKRSAAPSPQGLDIHGRQAPPVHKSVDDDQLEIPAFLRRQAN